MFIFRNLFEFFFRNALNVIVLGMIIFVFGNDFNCLENVVSCI